MRICDSLRFTKVSDLALAGRTPAQVNGAMLPPSPGKSSATLDSTKAFFAVKHRHQHLPGRKVRRGNALQIVHLLPHIGDPYPRWIGMCTRGNRNHSQPEASWAAPHMWKDLTLGPRRTRHLRRRFGYAELDKRPRALNPRVHRPSTYFGDLAVNQELPRIFSVLRVDSDLLVRRMGRAAIKL